MARHIKKAVICRESCHCLFYIGSEDENKIVINGGKIDAFHSHKTTQKQYVKNEKRFVSSP